MLGAAQAGRKKSLKLLSVLPDRDLIVAARQEATGLVDADPDLAGYPALAAEMSALLDEEQAGSWRRRDRPRDQVRRAAGR